MSQKVSAITVGFGVSCPIIEARTELLGRAALGSRRGMEGSRVKLEGGHIVGYLILITLLYYCVFPNVMSL